MAGPTEVVRTIAIDADPARVHALVNDFHEWTAWSPWEDVDPQMHRAYSGPDEGVGARYAWNGNRKAGAGSMEITGASPDRIDIELAFLKPFRSTNQVAFDLVATTTGTDVTWRMTSPPRGGVPGLFMRLVNLDKLVGGDFDKGLARLKAVAEQR